MTSADDLLGILDSLDAAVYVSDIHSYELVFLNAYGRKQWGAPAGRKCWQVIQKGQQGPCAFCNNAKLLDEEGRPGPVVVWEFQNTQNGRWYQCRDQAVVWSDGRLMRVEIATDITERKALEDALRSSHQQVARLAYRDELTRLPNRRAFFAYCHEQLASLAPEAPFAVVLIDLDQFKAINDFYGHAMGDEVLREVASRFQDQLRSSDLLARYGGEEFAMALPNASSAQALGLAERLRQSLHAAPFTLGEVSLDATASFGVAAEPAGELSLDGLLNAADQALYRAKRAGRDRVACGPQ
jgi:diguanylate cyclase (GGDEF)-like protein